MGEVEFGLEVKLYCDVLLSVLRLPPAVLPVAAERRHDVLNPMAVSVGVTVRTTRVADEALVVLVLEVTDDTVASWTSDATRRRRLETALAANQQITCSRVAATLLAQVSMLTSYPLTVQVYAYDADAEQQLNRRHNRGVRLGSELAISPS